MNSLAAMSLTPYQKLMEELENEREYSEALGLVVERITAEKLVLQRQAVALQEQLALADEMCGSVQAENNVLRDLLDQHGIQHAAIVTEE